MGSFEAVTPVNLRTACGQTTYVGPIGKHGDFGIVATTDNWGWARHPYPKRWSSANQVYFWKPFAQVDQPEIYAFAGPKIMSMKQVAALNLPPDLNFPTFPFYEFTSKR